LIIYFDKVTSRRLFQRPEDLIDLCRQSNAGPMCILPDHEIVRRTGSGELRIDNFSERSVTPNGYDLRIAEISMPGEAVLREGTAVITPGTLFFISTVERVELPSTLCAQLWMRTSWMRKGLLAGLGKVDAGFHGTLTFMAVNLSSAPVEVSVGERFVQIVFETLASPAQLTYSKRSGNYQGQTGVTLTPLHQPDVRSKDTA
jgi:dCTP deaminase